ncbi:MAG: haloacid dehalogenase-like hydrolase [Clostridia bacterium]|nr:haloacid dehalogenase-like hydrolase [Clostridia bacterium]
MKKLFVFDFDKTIYLGDSSIDIYLYELKKNILLIRFLPVQFFGMLMYKLKLKPKEYFKEKYFSFLKGVKDIDNDVIEFWNKNASKIKQEMLAGKNNIVVISASPEFLLKPICDKVGIDKLIATKVDSKTGKFLSKNCYGKEKVKRLEEEFSEYEIEEFYSDSNSDVHLALIAKSSFLVNKDKIEEWKLKKVK